LDSGRNYLILAIFLVLVATDYGKAQVMPSGVLRLWLCPEKNRIVICAPILGPSRQDFWIPCVIGRLPFFENYQSFKRCCCGIFTRDLNADAT